MIFKMDPGNHKGFATRNFVGVIQRIEMKVEESSKLRSEYLEIEILPDYGYDFTETNLSLLSKRAIG